MNSLAYCGWMVSGSKLRRIIRTNIEDHTNPYVASLCVQPKIDAKNFDEAEQQIQCIIQTFPTSPVGYLLLNLFYADIRKNEGLGFANLARALECNPSIDERFTIYHFRKLVEDSQEAGINRMDVSAYIFFEKHMKQSEIAVFSARNTLVSLIIVIFCYYYFLFLFFFNLARISWYYLLSFYDKVNG